MKLVVIGLGQGGSRVADEFAHLNNRAKSERKIEITPGVFAVNTDASDLSGLRYIGTGYQDRILLGGRKAGGHGVGKINEVGADIAKADGDKVIDAIRTAKRFYESDGFLLIAASGGGTGSGSLPVIAKMVKDRYGDKPVYALVILPFEHEETTEERTIYNTATCLKSIGQIADAVFLVDNQRYIRKDYSLRNNLAKINALIAEPFYDLLCAGEEKKAKFIGAKVVDAGDIRQTLNGWTVIGHGKSEVSSIRLPFFQTRNFRKKSSENHKGIQAMDEALSELSLQCNPMDAGRAMYTLTAPHKEMNLEIVKELGDYIRDLAPNAIIRNGDYPREGSSMDVTLILSQLSDVEVVRNYYYKSTDLVPEYQRRREESEEKLKGIDEAAKEIPSLVD
ncbi:tubulin/FtsZ family protein [Chloroflexota bacterium]